MPPLVGTGCGSPTGIPFAFADPGRTVEMLNPYDEEHANHTLVIAGPLGKRQDDDCECDARAVPGGRRARVRDRPRRPLRNPHPARRRGTADRDRRRRLAVRAEPVGRAGSGEGLPGEDRVPSGAARGDDGRAGRAADRDDRRRDPRRVREGGQSPGPAGARVDAPGRAARPGGRGTERRRGRRRGDASQPRRPPVRVLRRGHLRLPARPRDDGAERRAAGGVRHPPLPGLRAAGGDVLDHGIHHHARWSGTGGRTRRAPAARALRCFRAGRSC